MPLITPDLSDLDKPIEPGTYHARIASVDYQNAKTSGNPMIVPTFKVTVGDKERTRKAYLVITGNGAFNFEQLLRACRFDDYADKLKNGTKEPFDTDQLVDQELQIVVDSDTYNGQITDKIVKYLKA